MSLHDIESVKLPWDEAHPEIDMTPYKKSKFTLAVRERQCGYNKSGMVPIEPTIVSYEHFTNFEDAKRRVENMVYGQFNDAIDSRLSFPIKANQLGDVGTLEIHIDCNSTHVFPNDVYTDYELFHYDQEHVYPMTVDWSDMVDWVNSPERRSQTKYHVSDFSSEKEGPLGIVISSSDAHVDFDITNLVREPDDRVYCNHHYCKTLDECFESIKSDYAKAGKGWYEGMLRDYVKLDPSLSDADRQQAKDRIVKDLNAAKSPKQRNAAVDAEFGGIQLDGVTSDTPQITED